MRIVTKAFLRYLPRRRGLSTLQLLGIACGVAATVGMVLSAQTALSSFERAVEFLKGRATHRLTRPAGPVEETVVLGLMQDPGVKAFSPVIDRTVILQDGGTARFLGVDPFLDQAIRPELVTSRASMSNGSTREEALSFLLEEAAVFTDDELAARLGVRPGEMFQTSHGGLLLKGTFPSPSGEPLILSDISNAQLRFGLRGMVDRVELILSDPEGFRSRWNTGFVLESADQQRAALSDMLRAFRLNLEALSLLALFVGVFLVYNTAMFSVVSRRKEAGILLSLGASRREVLLAFLAEILLLGAAGGLLGGLIGYLLGCFLTGLVGETISKLYFFVRPVPPDWSWWVCLYGAMMGMGASLLGGALPLKELARVDPVRILQGRGASRFQGKQARRAALWGSGMLAASLVFVVAAEVHVYLGFAGAFALLLGASLLSGQVLIWLEPWLNLFLRSLGGVAGKLAAGTICRNLGRTAVAVAAFMVALSMSIGLGSMIGSFRETLVWWMDSQLKGDLYIAPSREIQVPEDFYEELLSLPGIGGLDPYRNTQLLYRGTPVYVSSVDAKVLQRYTRFGWLQGGNENWDLVRQGEVIVSESFSRRFKVRAGQEILLDGIRGPSRLRVAAIFFDYTTEHGLIMMDRSKYLELFGDRTIDSLVVFLDPDLPGGREILQDVVRRAQVWGLPVATQGEFHAQILEFFDSTFAVTRSMRIIAVVVAFLGIAGALLTLFMERQRDFGIYRALGFSTSRVASMTLMEGLGMGLVSYALSAAVGTALAWVLIYVINLRSFNWTVFFHFNWGPYLITWATATIGSLAAAVYPIWRVWRTYPQMQIREE